MKPLKFSISQVDEIPASIGVYVFFNDKGEALYVGKSVNLKARVKAHIKAAKISSKEKALIDSTSKIEIYLTGSEYSALILEARLIKKEKPKFNKIWKDDKSYLYIVITNEEFPKIYPAREKETKGALYSFGPFSSLKVVNSVLRSIRKIFPFCSQKKLGKKPCFYSKIGLCNPCPSEIVKYKNDSQEYKKLKDKYLENIKGVVRLLQGDLELLQEHFYQKLKELSEKQKFEEAIIVREQLKRLEALKFLRFEEEEALQLKLLWKQLEEFFKKYFPLKSLSRIECYDISVLAGKEPTGSMVVMQEGVLDKSEYKRFKVKDIEGKGDQQRLMEVIIRRFSHSWPKPDVILVDGGLPQMTAVKEALSKLKLEIPVVALAKQPDRVILKLNGKTKVFKDFSRYKYLNLLRLLRDEAHRFARKYHLLLRRKKLLV